MPAQIKKEKNIAIQERNEKDKWFRDIFHFSCSYRIIAIQNFSKISAEDRKEKEFFLSFETVVIKSFVMNKESNEIYTNLYKYMMRKTDVVLDI